MVNGLSDYFMNEPRQYLSEAVQNPVKHLKWSVLRKQLRSFLFSLTILCAKVVWIEYTSDELIKVPVLQRGETHPNNSSAFAYKLFECV